jgi:hypothetical protein
MSTVEFEVSYQFGEYRQFALEHGSYCAGKPFGILGSAFLSVVALPVFLLKASRVGRCSFSIDAAGIVRTSKSGELKIPWDGVTAVHKYTPGLLIEKLGGAVPVPYRCLAPAQRALLEALVKQWEGGSRKGGGDV